MTTRWTIWLPRLSLWQMFAVIGLVAGGFGLLRFPNHTVAAGVETALVALLIFAILLAIYSQSAARAYWVGSLIAGFVFFSLTKGSLPLLEFRMELVTSQLNQALFVAMYPEQIPTSTTGAPEVSYYVPNTVPYAFTPSTNLVPGSGTYYPYNISAISANYLDSSHFLRICDCLWTLIVAMLGGFVAMVLQRRNARLVMQSTSSRSNQPDATDNS